MVNIAIKRNMPSSKNERAITESEIFTVIENVINDSEGITEAEIPIAALSFIARDRKNKGIKLNTSNSGTYLIELYINVEYGVVIPEACWDLQIAVTREMQKTLGITPDNVNVHIVGVETAL